MNLITGATGLTGAHLALHLLNNGENVRAIYRTENSIQKTRQLFDLYDARESFDKIDWRQADVTDIPALEEAFAGVSHVFHCAAAISFNREDEEELRKTNIEGTANIVNLCLAHGVKKLCHVSSVAAVGDPLPGEKEVTEKCEWNPAVHHHDYAISKYGAEMEVWRGWQEGLEVAIVNPGIIIGPGFWGSGSGQIFSTVKKGMKVYTLGVTGYVSVWDVANILHRLMHSTIDGERFILVSENLTYRRVIDLVAEELKVKKPDAHALSWLTSLGWRIDWLFSLFGKKRLLSRDGAHSLHKKTFYSSDKIKKTLTFDFMPIEEAIKKTVRIQSRQRNGN